jgi:hypothetical protein
MPFSSSTRKSPCLRIAWHTGTAQDVLAGGFADGLVCLWKISCSSQLLRHTINGEEHLFPYLKFQPHFGPITALEISPFELDQPRFIFTGSIADKNMMYWDLEKLGEVSVGIYPRKSKVTCSTWMTLWPSAVVGSEEIHQGATFVPIRNFSRHYLALPQNSSTLSVDKGDWLNGIVQSTSAGEVSLMLLTQLIFGYDFEKSQKDKRALLTHTCSVSLLHNSNDECYPSYSEASKRGLVFHDISLDSDNAWCVASKSAQLPETMDSATSVNYPLTAINRVNWNPNWQSFGWITAGYQCGIVRGFFVKCKSSDMAVKNFIKQQSQIS